MKLEVLATLAMHGISGYSLAILGHPWLTLDFSRATPCLLPWRWGVKEGMVRVKLCDTLVIHGPYLSALETAHNKTLYKFSFFTLT